MIPHPNVAQAQREAAARVKTMEEHTRRLVREHPVNIYRGVAVTPSAVRPAPPAEPDCHTPCDPTEPPCETPVEPIPAPTPCYQNSRSLSLFGGDNERLLLLLLAAVLLKNGAPTELLLALLYIAL